MGKGSPSKKYELAKTSLLFQTKEFFSNSTLHGVRYIAEKGRPFFDKFLWLCCTSVGGTVTLIIIVSLWEKFQTNPTITGLDTDFHNWNVEFPGISICEENPIDYKRLQKLIAANYSKVTDKEKLLEYFELVGSLNRANLVRLQTFSQFQDFPKDNLKEIAMEVVKRCEDVVTGCKYKDEEIDCCPDFKPLFTENGFCYVFNVQPMQGILSLDGKPVPPFRQKHIFETDPKWALEFQVANADENPVYVYIHSSNQQAGLDLNAHHVWDTRISKIAFSAKTTYTTEDAEQLSIKQRHCVFPKEIKLLTDDTYTYGACMRECRMKVSFQNCKCVPFFYKKIPQYPLCDLTGYACIIKNIDKIMSKAVCLCELGCENTVYEVEKLTEASNDDLGTLEVAFVSWPMIRYKREVLFGWVDLLVSFGGIAGLFLGFSLLSGVEIIYYFTMRACCMMVREKDTLEELKKEYELEEKPPLDLTLTPYFMKKKEDEVNPAARMQYVQPFY